MSKTNNASDQVKLKQEILELRNQGLSAVAVAKKLGIHPSTVYYRLAEGKLPKLKKKQAPMLIEPHVDHSVCIVMGPASTVKEILSMMRQA